jgi:hypothetical protein
MTKDAGRSIELQVQSVDDFWSLLTDDELRQVVWSTDEPLKLANLQHIIPTDLSGFKIELEYHLDAGSEEVHCAHCPRHQRHRHGYVLQATDGRRFLLGSHCGPKAYASDYWIASAARNRAKRRAEALMKWDRLRGQLPVVLHALEATMREPNFQAVRRVRGGWEAKAPRILSFLRSRPRDSLTGAVSLKATHRYLDLTETQRREELFVAEAAKLAHLPNKAHRAAVENLNARIDRGPVYRTDEHDFGVLRGADWLLAKESPFKSLEGVSRRLRGYHLAGATSQDKTVARLEQFSRECRKDLSLAGQLLKMIGSAGVLFEFGQLDRLTRWSNYVLGDVGKIEQMDGGLRAKDTSALSVVLALPANWEVPGKGVLDLI